MDKDDKGKKTLTFSKGKSDGSVHFNDAISKNADGNYGILKNFKVKGSDADLYESNLTRELELTSPANIHSKRKHKTARILFFTCSWYLLATALSLFNKFLLGKTNYGFPFPMFMAMVHMMAHFVMAACVMQFLFPQLKPQKFPSLRNYWLKVFPCGLATGMDISFSNSSLQYISLSFYTMVKSSAPVLVLLFAFLFRLEKPTWKLMGVMSIISLGTLLTVIKQPGFNTTGFIQVSFATLCSGLRWSITQILLQREEMGMSNPVATMFFLTPLMAMSLAVATLAMEGFGNIWHSAFFGPEQITKTVLMLVAGGVLAFLMTMAEFMLISISSVVTFSVLGIMKEILTITVSHIIFKDQFAPINLVGLAISLCGIALYHVIRIQQLEKRHGTQEFFFNDEDLQVASSSNSAAELDVIDKPSAAHDGDLSLVYKNRSLSPGLTDADGDSYVAALRNSMALTSSSFGYAPIYVPRMQSTNEI